MLVIASISNVLQVSFFKSLLDTKTLYCKRQDVFPVIKSNAMCHAVSVTLSAECDICMLLKL